MNRVRRVVVALWWIVRNRAFYVAYWENGDESTVSVEFSRTPDLEDSGEE